MGDLDAWMGALKMQIAMMGHMQMSAAPDSILR
jgi:hypothetical protein